jgi:predicted enzyme related to lactoylglutathione lyase
MSTKTPNVDPSTPSSARQTPAQASAEAPTPLVHKVAFTLLPVHDVERARQFYEQVLGLKVGLHGGKDGMWWVEYDLPGGGCIALTNTTGADPSVRAGAMLALEVHDLPALIAQLKSAGVRFLGDVIRGPRCHMITCVDSEGNALLLHQLDRAPA